MPSQALLTVGSTWRLQGGGVHGNALLTKFDITDARLVHHRWLHSYPMTLTMLSASDPLAAGTTCSTHKQLATSCSAFKERLLETTRMQPCKRSKYKGLGHRTHFQFLLSEVVHDVQDASC